MTGATSAQGEQLAVWSEFLPFEELRSRALLAALASRGVALRVAVMPDVIGGIRALRRACEAAGVELGVWPLLPDEGGRWGSCANADAYAAHARAVAEAAASSRRVAAVALDLEPPIGWVRGALGGRARLPPRYARSAEEATARLCRLVGELRASSRRIEAAAIPTVLADLRTAGWQQALGTPVDALPVDQVSVMLYTSLIEGYSRRMLRRRDALALLGLAAQKTRRRYGHRAAISLGVVGSGALGDERGYRGPDELAEDTAIARAAGIDRLALYGLDGIIARAPIEPWLDALVEPKRAASGAKLTGRACAAWTGLRLASPALAALMRVR